MADRLSLTIAADSSQLTTSLNVATQAMKVAERAFNNLSRTAAKTGDALDLAKAGQAGAAFVQTAKGVDAATKALEGAAKASTQLGQSFALNRGGLMELRAAGVNSFQALASGMDVTRVAMMEGAQVLGGLVQGIDGLGLKLGIVGGGVALIAGGFGFLIAQAATAKRTFDELANTMAVTGRAGSALDFANSAKSLAAEWKVTESEAASVLKILGESTRLTREQQEQVARIALAMSRITGQSSSDIAKGFVAKTVDDLVKMAKSFDLATTSEEKLIAAGRNGEAVVSLIDRISGAVIELGKHSETTWEKLKKIFSPSTPGAVLGDFPAMPGPSADFRKGAGSPAPANAGRAMVDMLVGRGFTPQAAAAIAGNAQVESGFSTTIENPKSGAYGLFQWLGDRKTAVQAEAGTDWTRQIDFMVKELDKLDPQFRKSTGAPGDLALRFESVFERSGGALNPQRRAAAEGYGAPLGAGKSEDAKAEEERKTRVEAAENARRAIAHKNSLEAQVRDAEAWHDKMLNEHHKDSAEELAAETDLEQKKRALKDQSLALDLARIDEELAKTTDAAKKVPLLQQKVSVATAAGASVMEIQGLQTALSAGQRAATQESYSQSAAGVSAMIGARGDQFRGFQAQQAVGVREQTITPIEALNAELAKSKELADENAASLHELYGAVTNNTDRVKVWWEMWREGMRASTEQQQLLAQKAQATKQLQDTWSEPIRTAFTSVESSLKSSASGLLTGSTTWAKALKSVTDSMISGLVDSITGSLSKSLAKGLGAKAGEGLFSFLGDKLAGSLFSGGAGAAGGGGLFSLLLAPLGLSHGGIIPSAAGGWSLPSFAGAQPAMLHSREMVLPAHISDGLQNAIGSGGLGGGVNFHLHAVAADGPAISRLFKDNGRAIHDAVRSGIRNNALTPRTI
jgi:hypothetical protein